MYVCMASLPSPSLALLLRSSSSSLSACSTKAPLFIIRSYSPDPAQLRKTKSTSSPFFKAAAESLLESLKISSFDCNSKYAATAATGEEDPGVSGWRSVWLFWDLDNKPPKVRPYDVARKLRSVVGRFGKVVEFVAYANQHAFKYVPEWVRDERRERKVMDVLEAKGVVVPPQPYVCGLCGRKCKTNFDLKKHFKQLHERERQKRMARVNMLKGKKKMKFKDRISDKESRYKEASRDLVLPKVGYGLAAELKRAGVYVRTVEDKPQAADIALKQRMTAAFSKGLDCLCLVSDDTGFAEVLKSARARNFSIIVVGETPALRKFADLWLSWGDLALDKPHVTAIEIPRLSGEKEDLDQGLAPELDDGVWTRSFAHSSDMVLNKFNLLEGRSFISHRRAPVSAFSEEEEEMLEEEEEEEEEEEVDDDDDDHDNEYCVEENLAVGGG